MLGCSLGLADSLFLPRLSSTAQSCPLCLPSAQGTFRPEAQTAVPRGPSAYHEGPCAPTDVRCFPRGSRLATRMPAESLLGVCVGLILPKRQPEPLCRGPRVGGPQWEQTQAVVIRQRGPQGPTDTVPQFACSLGFYQDPLRKWCRNEWSVVCAKHFSRRRQTARVGEVGWARWLTGKDLTPSPGPTW